MAGQRGKLQPGGQGLGTQAAQLYIINATKIAVQAGLGKSINMVMQSVFLKLSCVTFYAAALELLRESIEKLYGKKGDGVVQMSIDGVNASLAGIVQCSEPAAWAELDLSDGEKRPSGLQTSDWHGCHFPGSSLVGRGFSPPMPSESTRRGGGTALSPSCLVRSSAPSSATSPGA